MAFKFLLRTLFLCLALFVVSTLLFMVCQIYGVDFVTSFQKSLAALKPYLAAVRCVLISSVFWYWEGVVNYMGKVAGWSSQEISTLKRSRKPLFLFVLVFELVLVQRLPLTILGI